MRFVSWRAGSIRLATLPLLLAGAVALGAAVAPATVSAHARLRSTEPAAGATLGGPPAHVTLTFSETPDVRLTSIKVLDSGGTDRVAGPVEAVEVAGEPAVSVRVPLGDLPDGAYTVSWRTVSAVDAHISAGTFVFGVGVPPPTPTGRPGGASGDVIESGSPPAIGARWLLYVGLMALIGAAWIALAVARRPAADLLAMAAVGWVLTAAGTAGVVAVQWAETGAPIEALPSTSIGVAALARGISLAVVAVALVALATVRGLAGRRGWALVGAAAAAAFVIDVGTGHAAAGPAWIAQVAAQSLHGLGAAAWVGGLAGLLVALRTTPADERVDAARRYSSWAGVALAVVAVTGAARAFAEIGTLEALTGTDFGRVVIAKSGLLLLLAALGAANRFFTLRNAERVARLLRRIGVVEVAVAIGVLGLSALLVNLSPPASAGGPAAPVARPIIATGHDFGTSVRARLVTSPGSAGSNDFDLAMTDYDSGAPVDATAVELRFEIVSLSGMGPSTLDLEREAAGRFGASGPNLSIDGIWNVTATVTVPGGAVAVPLVVATRVADQPVERLVSPGLPTIYSVSLGAIGTAQVYLDPGGPGPNELHVTFFDAAGNAQPIGPATALAAPAGADGVLLVPRMLEPSHFVATVDATAGSFVLDVVAPLLAAAGSGSVHLHVTIDVTP